MTTLFVAVLMTVLFLVACFVIAVQSVRLAELNESLRRTRNSNRFLSGWVRDLRGDTSLAQVYEFPRGDVQ